MRYFLAILSLVIAAVLIVLGVGQRTFLAGPSAVREDLQIPQDSQYLVIPESVFALHEGNPSVIVNGENVFFAFAAQRDVDAWVEPFAHATVSADLEAAELNVTPVAALAPDDEADPSDSPEEADGTSDEEADVTEDETEDESVPYLDPRGSDLWLAEHEAEASLKVAVSLDHDQSIIVAAGDGSTAPDEAYILWAQEKSTPLAGPLLATGALFGALGALLYLFAIDHDRRGLGPRRGRRGPLQGLRNPRVERQEKSRTPSGARRGSRLGMTAVTGLALTLGLSACSPSYWPQPPAEPEVTEAPVIEDSHAVVPVKAQQLERILADIVLTVNTADRELDAELLGDRMTGPALEQRQANYTIREAEADWRALPYLTEERLSYDLVQSTEKWPRTIFVTVESSDVAPAEEATDDEEVEPLEDAENDAVDIADPQPEAEISPTLALLLHQATPHENYKISRVIELRGGIQMPAAAPVTEGTAVLANDIKTLKQTPKETVAVFAEILQNGVETEGAEIFDLDDEHLLANMGGQWAANNCSEGLSCSAETTVNDAPIVTLSTGQGGALVLATINDSHIMNVDGERNVISLTSIEQALGLEGNHRSVTRLWEHDVLFYVPNADAPGRISILGSSSEIIGVIGD